MFIRNIKGPRWEDTVECIDLTAQGEEVVLKTTHTSYPRSLVRSNMTRCISLNRLLQMGDLPFISDERILEK